ncbi:microfibril-associated glycoprotein 4-like [Anopheles darlingi]|uniref:microfibril-associated glycoprotein 4-like n=1 Tax=Anopheles darlingi TaxID=43151 RepID=UPI00210063FD|nr:microfibril-associated glycoprotein 4-like [Anopheles darlingi]
MKSIICFLLICATFYVGATSKCPENIDVDTSPIESILETVLKVMLDRFDDMDRKLMELQIEVNEVREEVERNRIAECVTPSSTPPQLETTATTEPPTTTTTTTTQPTVTEPPTYASCKDVPANASGVYLIRVNNDSPPFKVFCEMDTFGGGWIVVQHRFDGSVDFYRNWTQYRDGFGELDNEFWLGLEHVHQLTTRQKHEIIFEIKDFSGNYGYARYNEFQVGSESEQYILKVLGSYNGTAGNAMVYNKGYMFSTMDRDATSYIEYNCPRERMSAWWYFMCTRANLNGQYANVTDNKSMYWLDFNSNYQGMSFSRMMIREL